MVEIQGENGTALTGKQFTNAESAGTLKKVGVIIWDIVSGNRLY